MSRSVRITSPVFVLACFACGESTTPASDSGVLDAAALDGGTFDADVLCTPAETRAVPCGRCGVASQRCGSDGRWELPGICTDEGECEGGSMETETTALCGERVRVCTSECTWGAWTATVPDGACEPGTTRDGTGTCAGPSEAFRETCQADCGWTGACVDACGETARVTPADAIEVCVPGGPFVRGDAVLADAIPVAEVTVAAFLIDRYPVTVRRWRACVDAGICTPPERAPSGAYTPDRDAYPVQGVSWLQSEVFCEWDGGRRLPTEAEWEKAARGPSPRMPVYPWGDERDCAHLLTGSCPGVVYTETIPDRYDELPTTASYYGAEMMIGGPENWVFDAYDAEYYADPSSLSDPRGPDERSVRDGGSRTRVVRGWLRVMDWGDRHRAGARSGESISFPWRGARCARDVDLEGL